MLWQLIGDDALQFRRWGPEFVVYNTLSGDTHVLEAAAADILLTLQVSPRDMLSLAQLLADKWQCEPDENLVGQIEMALSDMQALSLVERV